MTIPPDYPWRPGTLSLQHGVPARLVGQDAAGRWNAWDASGTWLRYASLDGIEPDLTDGATKGALLEAVREAYGDPTAYVMPDGDTWVVWACIPGDDARSKDGVAEGPTEGAALLAAWEARPR